METPNGLPVRVSVVCWHGMFSEMQNVFRALLALKEDGPFGGAFRVVIACLGSVYGCGSMLIGHEAHEVMVERCHVLYVYSEKMRK
jgi:hypothetical protein